MRSDRLLVTGGRGFIGKALLEAASTSGAWSYIATVGRRPVAARPFRVKCFDETVTIDHLVGDLCDPVATDDLVKATKPSVVVHLAGALRHADERMFERQNVEATENLLDAIARHRPDARVVLGSSGGVSGPVDSGQLPVSEDIECRPINPYARSKRKAEELALARAAASADIVVARLFNIVGPGQDESHLPGRIAGAAARALVRASSEVLRLGRLDGTRDYVDVRDAAQGLLVALQHGARGGIYNIASGTESTGFLVLETLLRHAGNPSSLKVAIEPVVDDGIARHAGDSTRLRGLGWEPTRSLESSLGDLFRWRAECACRADRLS